MSETRKLFPPIDEVVEKEFVTFDFVSILGAGITLSAPTVTCVVSELSSIQDDAASSRILAGPQLVPSPRTAAANTAVSVMIGTMVGDVIYLLQCVANASDGQVLSLDTHIDCRIPQ